MADNGRSFLVVEPPVRLLVVVVVDVVHVQVLNVFNNDLSVAGLGPVVDENATVTSEKKTKIFEIWNGKMINLIFKLKMFQARFKWKHPL